MVFVNAKEIQKLKKTADFLMADYLFTDEPFGVLTRPALELVMSNGNGGIGREKEATLYIIDFKDIHKLNSQRGYQSVNNMIKRTIADLTGIFDGLIIGRIFSGDEIAIIDDLHRVGIIPTYAGICMEHKLGFKWIETEILLGQTKKSHKKQLNDLSEKLQTSCYSKVL